jgi:hypothetical protein
MTADRAVGAAAWDCTDSAASAMPTIAAIVARLAENGRGERADLGFRFNW